MTNDAISQVQLPAVQFSDREREVIFTQLWERTSDGLVLIQAERFVYLNSRFAEMLGYRIADLQDMPFLDFVHPQDLSIVTDHYQRRMAGEPVPARYECGLLHRSGQRISVELNAGIVEFQGQPADLVFLRDVSDHKRAQKRMQRLLDQQLILN
ncbi:MAG: PAS domain S-box protein, partial [Anaerolineales bacterium]|nr:PAS domain S-box protein [Anaerolineales bacterium]